jgi:ribosomal protein S18 acetylase RimI-like enzyme
MTQALAFPSPALPSWLDASGLSQAGLSVRTAGDADLPYLRGLYAQSRADELASVPWPDAARRAFCDSQFDLQHRHYLTHGTPGLFLIVRREGRSIGRLYLHWTSEELRIVDLLIDASTQGQGVGSTLLRWLQDLATKAGFGAVSLHVGDHNERAYALYRRLNFESETAGDRGHRRMVWRAPAAEHSVS